MTIKLNIVILFQDKILSLQTFPFALDNLASDVVSPRVRKLTKIANTQTGSPLGNVIVVVALPRPQEQLRSLALLLFKIEK